MFTNFDLKFVHAQHFVTVYENEETVTTPPAGDPPPATPPGTPPTQFTQEQVNTFVAEERRKQQKIIESNVAQLEQLKKSKGLTEKERGDLQSKIEELNSSLMTKEQLAAKEREKLLNEHKRSTETLTSERDEWKTRFQTSTIKRSIMDEALKADAFNPSQIVELLASKTRLVEVLDAEQNPIPGEFVPKIKMADTDKDGQPITLDLTVAEALKRMRDRADEYGNLFKSGIAGGLGGSAGRGSSRIDDPSKMTTEQYREWRNKRLNRKD